MQETQVRSLGQKDPLEKGMATHSSILAWRIPMGRGVWQMTVHGVEKSWTWLSDFHFTSLHRPITFHYLQSQNLESSHGATSAPPRRPGPPCHPCHLGPGLRSTWERWGPEAFLGACCLGFQLGAEGMQVWSLVRELKMSCKLLSQAKKKKRMEATPREKNPPERIPPCHSWWLLVNFFLHLLEQVLKGFPSGSVDKNPPANPGDMSSIPGLGKFRLPQSC